MGNRSVEFGSVPADSELVKLMRSEQMAQEISTVNGGVRKTLMNLEKLASSESEMVQLQRKTIYVQ